MDKILESMASNVPGIVGVIIVVVLFLKFQKSNLDQIRAIGDSCHVKTSEDRKAYQDQIKMIIDRHEALVSQYNQGMQEFARSIGANGEVLIRMEKALVHTHRRQTDPDD